MLSLSFWATQLQQGLVEDAQDDVDVLPQVAQDLSRVLGCVLEGHDAELHLGTELMDLWPDFGEGFGGSQGRSADADQVLLLHHGLASPLLRFPHVLLDVAHIFEEGLACLRKAQTSVGPVEELDADFLPEEVHLFYDCGARDVAKLTRLVEAA